MVNTSLGRRGADGVPFREESVSEHWAEVPSPSSLDPPKVGGGSGGRKGQQVPLEPGTLTVSSESWPQAEGHLLDASMPQAGAPAHQLRRAAAGGRCRAAAAGHLGGPVGVARAAGSARGSGRRARPGARGAEGLESDRRATGGRGLHRRCRRATGRRHGGGVGSGGGGPVHPGHVLAQLPLGAGAPAGRGEPGSPGPRLGGGGRAGCGRADDRPRLHSLRDLRPGQGGGPRGDLPGRARLSPPAGGGGGHGRGAAQPPARGHGG